MALETISAGTAVHGRFNLAGQVPGERSDELQHLALQVGRLGEGPITLPCKTIHITETARPYAQRIGEVRCYLITKRYGWSDMTSCSVIVLLKNIVYEIFPLNPCIAHVRKEQQ